MYQLPLEIINPFKSGPTSNFCISSWDLTHFTRDDIHQLQSKSINELIHKLAKKMINDDEFSWLALLDSPIKFNKYFLIICPEPGILTL